MSNETILTQNLEKTIEQFSQEYAKATFWHQQTVEHTQATYDQSIAENERHYQEIMAKGERDYTSALAGLDEQRAQHLADLDYQAALAWTEGGALNPIWQRWMPASEPVAPEALSLGQLTNVGPGNETITLPALVPFGSKNPLLLRTAGLSQPQAVQAIQSLMLRLLATVPPGKLRFTLIDPVGLGQNVAAFMKLVDYDENFVTNRAWTEPQQIEQRLAELTEHLENVIQRYLRNEFETIDQYNKVAKEIAEPYRVLVVMDFPTNFSEDAARRLVSIAQNGPRCGIYTLVIVDTEKPMPYGFNLADLERDATIVAWNDERRGFVYQDDDFQHCQLTLDALPTQTIIREDRAENEREVLFVDHIIEMVGKAAQDASNVQVPFAEMIARLLPKEESWWQANTSSGVQIPLGPTGAKKLQHLAFGQSNSTAHHALVVGRTGSGKSTLLHTLITSAALLYSPDEIELYLIDFKEGVEFKVYAGGDNDAPLPLLPHARVIAIQSEREFGLSVLQGLDTELKRRGDLFRDQGVDGLNDYRNKTGKVIPRILLLVDEFQEFFVEDDNLSSQASQLLDNLVRRGRSFGIHILLGSQTLSGAYSLSRSTIEQMGVRIALQCSDSDSRLVLGDDNPAARLLSRPGEAIYNDDNGRPEGNDFFQTAWLSQSERADYLMALDQLAQARNYEARPIIFEGNAPALMEQNQPLQQAIQTPSTQPPRRLLAWLGDPIAIKDPTAAIFRRQSASNLLIVGQNDEMAMGMTVSTILSLLAQSRDAQIYLLDFGSADASYVELLPQLATRLPNIQRGRRRELPDLINEVATTVNSRLDVADGALQDAPPLYLIIFGLQRARDLRPNPDQSFSSFSFDSDLDAAPPPPNPDQQFLTILREGPDLGVHTIAWCDTNTNLSRVLEWQGLREFEMRVTFQMSSEDSTKLLDTPAASKLGQHRAIYYSEDEGLLEKFRPYGLPDPAWLDGVMDRLS